VKNAKRTYGLILRRHDRHGYPHIDACMVCRENDAAHPINCRAEGECAIYEDCGAHDRRAYDGLGLYGFVSEVSLGFIGASRPEYRDVHAIDSRLAGKMSLTLARIDRKIERLAAREPGDVFMAFCDSLSLDFVVIRTGGTSSSYPDCDWAWFTPAEGRNLYRQWIETAIAEERARKGKAA